MEWNCPKEQGWTSVYKAFKIKSRLTDQFILKSCKKAAGMRGPPARKLNLDKIKKLDQNLRNEKKIVSSYFQGSKIMTIFESFYPQCNFLKTQHDISVFNSRMNNINYSTIILALNPRPPGVKTARSRNLLVGSRDQNNNCYTS